MGLLPFLCTPVIEKKKKAKGQTIQCVCFLATKIKPNFCFHIKYFWLKGKEVNLTFKVLCEWSHLEKKVGN